MAILDEFEVKLLVNNIEAKEYADDEDDESGPSEVPNYVEATSDDEYEYEYLRPKVITKYVEAVSGANFAVMMKVQETFKFEFADSITANLSIDGEQRRGVVWEKSKVQQVGGQVSTRSGVSSVRPGSAKQDFYKFQFGQLETRDIEKTDNVSDFKNKYGELGTITVKFWRTFVKGPMVGTPLLDTTYHSVPEKALKGRPLDIAARLQTTNTTRTTKFVDTRRIDSEPVATITLKYRTRRALQSLMIVERSPTPPPLEERKIEDLTREEMAELIRRQREQDPVIKDEKKHKRERSTTIIDLRPLKSSKGTNGETIFHLDSEDEDNDVAEEEEIEELPKTEPGAIEVVDLI